MRTLAAVAMALVLATPAMADYEAGRRALEAGHTDTAIVEWQAAATGGDRQAMLALGQLFAQGLGVLQDYVEAHKWFNLAASRGAVEGVQERDALLEFMTPSQIEAAQQRAAHWLAETAPAEVATQLAVSVEPEAPGSDEPVAQQAPVPPSAEEIRQAQTLLAELGYPVGAADGKWGPRSAQAYAAFRRDSSLPAEESLSREGLQAMRDEANRRMENREAAAVFSPDSAPAESGTGVTTASSAGPSAGEAIATVLNLFIQGYHALQLAKLAKDPESFALVAPELQTLLTKMLTGLSDSDLSSAGEANVTLSALTPRERGQLSDLLETDQGLPAETRAALSDALRTTPDSAAGLRPKCADLPGQYLDENDAECWVEIENQSGCYVWKDHYHSDRTTSWSGQCRGGIVDGRGTLSETAGSEHEAWEANGAFSGGKLTGRWVWQSAAGDRTEGEYRDGRRNGFGTFSSSDGYRYEGEYRDGKKHGRGTLIYGEGEWHGDRYEGEWREGKRTGYGAYTWSSGARYEGAFIDGKRTGQGTYVWPDGSRFEGEWRDDKRNGRGTGFSSDDEPWRTCEFRNDESVEETCTYY